MSGGAFDYKQWHIEEIADEIEQRILTSGRQIPKEVLESGEWGYYPCPPDEMEQYYPEYSPKTIDIMKRAVYVLRMAHIYAQRVDWMLSGDDSEESLVRRLKEELDELKEKYPSGKFTYKKHRVKFDKENNRFREMTEEE